MPAVLDGITEIVGPHFFVHGGCPSDAGHRSAGYFSLTILDSYRLSDHAFGDRCWHVQRHTMYFGLRTSDSRSSSSMNDVHLATAAGNDLRVIHLLCRSRCHSKDVISNSDDLAQRVLDVVCDGVGKGIEFLLRACSSIVCWRKVSTSLAFSMAMAQKRPIFQ